jgi:choline dehydrogenase
MAASGDHKKAPRIVGNYLNEPADVDALVSGVRKAREVLAGSPFDDVRGEEMLPGSQATSDDDLRGFVHDRFELLYHPVGTCRIGDVANGVVSPDLSVHGMIGLRVADASVMPATISGNTNAASMMIGSRAVDLILGRASAPS